MLRQVVWQRWRSRWPLLMGAGIIIAAVGSDDKAETASLPGCERNHQLPREDLIERVRVHTGCKGADIILEVGGEVFNRSLAALALFGRLATFGQTSGQPGARYCTLDAA